MHTDLRAKYGDQDTQQIWESLVLLISVRHWYKHWAQRRVPLQFQSDNMADFTLASQLKASGPRRRIAKELALVYARAVFEPDIVEHIPGVMNVTPDSLSRRYQSPGWCPPASRREARDISSVRRNASWWVSLSSP